MTRPITVSRVPRAWRDRVRARRTLRAVAALALVACGSGVDSDAGTEAAPTPTDPTGGAPPLWAIPSPEPTEAVVVAVADVVEVEDVAATPDVGPELPPPAEDVPAPGPELPPVDTGPPWLAPESTDPACTEDAGLALYELRIEPLVSGDQPKSCNQCHLSGVDLAMFVRDTPCQSMACLLAQDEVDLADPPASKILERILLAEPESALITEAVIQAEYDGFLEWITWSATCHDGVCGTFADPCGQPVAGPEVPTDVLTPLGSCSEDDLLAVFEERVHHWKGRCTHCHAKCSDDAAWPCWMVDEADKEDPVGVSADALATMYNLIGLGAVDVDAPLESSMLLKPLSTNAGGVDHGGGSKFVDTADQAYQDYVVWLEHYAACWYGEAPQKPLAAVTSPKHKKKFLQGSPVTFAGDAVDPQDGPLPDDALVWTSDLVTGPIGTGRGPFTLTLGVGDHVVTLTATDSDGLVGTRKLVVRIKEAE